MRIVQLANFYSPHSGGIRTTLDALGMQYRRAGHERILVVPGADDADVETEAGRRVVVAAPSIPRSGGYHLLIRREPLRRLLEELRPDVIEVSDQVTMRWVGSWAKGKGVPATVVAHERLDLVVSPFRAPATLVHRHARFLGDAFDNVVCASKFGAAPFTAAGVPWLHVPFGVDLDWFHPRERDPERRSSVGADTVPLLMYAGRLSREKRPKLAIDALRAVRQRGIDAVLVIAGDGPLRSTLENSARGLPVHFLGWVADRRELAAWLASADVVLNPGPAETFGLAALEALAAGTPVVAAGRGAVGELVDPTCGVLMPLDAGSFASGIESLLQRPDISLGARRRAEQFRWSTSAERLLAVHGLKTRLVGSRP